MVARSEPETPICPLVSLAARARKRAKSVSRCERCEEEGEEEKERDAQPQRYELTFAPPLCRFHSSSKLSNSKPPCRLAMRDEPLVDELLAAEDDAEADELELEPDTNGSCELA